MTTSESKSPPTGEAFHESPASDQDFTLSDIKVILLAIEEYVADAALQLAEPVNGAEASDPEAAGLTPEVAQIARSVSLTASAIANIGKKLNKPDLAIEDIISEMSTLTQSILSAAVGVSNIKIDQESPKLDLSGIKGEIDTICIGLGIAPPNASEAPSQNRE